jgi:hypothetical protein
MSRNKVAITVNQNTLDRVDQLVSHTFSLVEAGLLKSP